MIEVPVTVTRRGGAQAMEWDCAHCGQRQRSGKHGIESSCPHKVFLRARKFDDVVAVFEEKSKVG